MFFKLLYTTAQPLTEDHRDKNWVIENFMQARFNFLVTTTTGWDPYMLKLSTGSISSSFSSMLRLRRSLTILTYSFTSLSDWCHWGLRQLWPWVHELTMNFKCAALEVLIALHTRQFWVHGHTPTVSLFDPQSWMLITDYYLPHFSYFVNEFYCYNFDLIYFMLSGKLELDIQFYFMQDVLNRWLVQAGILARERFGFRPWIHFSCMCTLNIGKQLVASSVHCIFIFVCQFKIYFCSFFLTSQ